MLDLDYTTQMGRDLKLAKKRHKDLSKLQEVTDLLQKEEELPDRFHNHKLSGNYKNHWECHIEPDWLLIYYYSGSTIILVRNGSHADLFS